MTIFQWSWNFGGFLNFHESILRVSWMHLSKYITLAYKKWKYILYKWRMKTCRLSWRSTVKPRGMQEQNVGESDGNPFWQVFTLYWMMCFVGFCCNKWWGTGEYAVVQLIDSVIVLGLVPIFLMILCIHFNLRLPSQGIGMWGKTYLLTAGSHLEQAE